MFGYGVHEWSQKLVGEQIIPGMSHQRCQGQGAVGTPGTVGGGLASILTPPDCADTHERGWERLIIYPGSLNLLS